MSLPTIEEIMKKQGIVSDESPNAEQTKETNATQESAEHEETEEHAAIEEKVQSAIQEKAETEEKVEEKPKDPFAKRFAALTRLDKERRQKQHDLEQRIAQFEAQQKEFQTKSSKKYTSALDLLKDHGMTYDQAVYEVLGSTAPQKEEDPVDQKVRSHLDPLGQKLSAVEQKIAELDAATKRFNDMQEQQAERELRYGLQAVIKDGPYPYISGLGDEAFSLVYDTLVGSYSDPSSKQKLTYKQACDKVEAYYKRIGSIGNTKKEDTVTDTKVPVKKQASDTPTAKTLTQAHSGVPRSNKQSAIDSMDKYKAIEEVSKMLRYRS